MLFLIYAKLHSMEYGRTQITKVKVNHSRISLALYSLHLQTGYCMSNPPSMLSYFQTRNTSFVHPNRFRNICCSSIQCISSVRFRISIFLSTQLTLFTAHVTFAFGVPCNDFNCSFLSKMSCSNISFSSPDSTIFHCQSSHYIKFIIITVQLLI